MRELSERIEAFAVAAWTGRTEALGGRVVRHDGLATFLTGLPAPPFNPTVVEGPCRDAVAALAAAESLYGPVGLPFGIDLDPDRWPELRRASERAGLTMIESRPLMALAAAELVAVVPPGGVRIAPGGDVLDAVARVDTAAFGGDLGVNRAFVGGAEKDPGARVYAAFLDGIVVGSGETFVAEGVMGVFGVATAPEARRRGIGSALTSFAISDRLAEIDVVILDSSDLGHGVYERLGFRDVAISEIWVRREE